MTWHKTMTGKADTDFMTRQRTLITDRYCAMRDSLYAYIRKCTDNSAEALKSGMQDGTLQILPDAGK